MPPMLPPVTHRSEGMSSASISQRCASTMSATVTTGKESPYGRPRLGVDRGGPGAARTSADDVRTDDEVAVGVERLPGPHRVVPPAGLPVVGGVLSGDMRVAGQRMADQNGVAAIRVQGTVGLVRQRDRPEGRPALQTELLIEGDLLRVDDHGRRPLSQDAETPVSLRLLKRAQSKAASDARCETYSACTSQRRASAPTQHMGLFSGRPPRPS